MYFQAVDSLTARYSKRTRERDIGGFVGDHKKMHALILLRQKVRQAKYITLYSSKLYGIEVGPNVTNAHGNIHLSILSWINPLV